MGKLLLNVMILTVFLVGLTSASLDYSKSGQYITSINKILKLDDSQIDLATALLLASREWNSYTNHRKYIFEIDRMADEIYKNSIKKSGQTDPINLVKEINRYLYEQKGYTAVKDANNPDDLFLHSVIENRQGYCLSLSALYLSIGERLELPLYGVVVPGHFFVRYDDGVNRFNIETTSSGNLATDQHYIEKFKVPSNGHDHLYMQNLTKKQTIGCFYNNLGNCYQNIGQTDKALEIFETAIELAPTLTESLNNLGSIYMQKGSYFKAMNCFKSALRINPNDANIHLNIGNVYLCQQNPSLAIISLKKAVSFSPELYQGYLSLARAYREKELYNTALNFIDKAMNYTASPELWREYGLIYQSMGQLSLAEDYFTRALQEKPCWAEVYFDLALLYESSHDKTKEIESYKSALDCNPNLTPAMQNLGNSYLKNGEIEKGLDLFLTAIEIDRDNPDLYFGAGLAYAQKKEYKLAVSYYKQSLRLQRNNKSACYNLAVCCYNLKEYELAREYAVKAQNLGFELPEGFLKELDRLID